MIYTCTLNPSLDYYMEFYDDIKINVSNRSSLEYYKAGGKGINVSKVLSNLKIPNRAFGFLGGFTKEFFIKLLSEYEYIQPAFTIIDGNTRINLKVKHSLETDFNATGPTITEKQMNSLMDKVSKTDEGDYLVFGGSIHDYLLDKVEIIIKDAIYRGVKVVLDSNSSIIDKCLKYNPFLVRFTLSQISEVLKENLEFNSISDLINPCNKLLERGVENIVVTLDNGGILFVCKQGFYYCDYLESVSHVKKVGLGDSIVAGFTMNSIRTPDIIDSFKFACCCGIATIESEDVATKEKVYEIYKNIEIRKIGE